MKDGGWEDTQGVETIGTNESGDRLYLWLARKSPIPIFDRRFFTSRFCERLSYST